MAQSFTANVTGKLVKINVGVSVDSCPHSGVFTGTAILYSGDGCDGSKALSLKTYSWATNSSFTMRAIPFGDVEVAKGESYTIRLSGDKRLCRYDSTFRDSAFTLARWSLENVYNCGDSLLGGTGYENCVPYDFDFYLQTYVFTSPLGISSSAKYTKVAKIYPNPSTTYLTFDMENNNPLSLQIRNAFGQVVFTTIVNQKATIDTHTLGGKGMYYAEIADTQNNILETQKIVVE
jgi:hypothetical protein